MNIFIDTGGWIAISTIIFQFLVLVFALSYENTVHSKSSTPYY